MMQCVSAWRTTRNRSVSYSMQESGHGAKEQEPTAAQEPARITSVRILLTSVHTSSLKCRIAFGMARRGMNDECLRPRSDSFHRGSAYTRRGERSQVPRTLGNHSAYDQTPFPFRQGLEKRKRWTALWRRHLLYEASENPSLTFMKSWAARRHHG